MSDKNERVSGDQPCADHTPGRETSGGVCHQKVVDVLATVYAQSFKRATVDGVVCRHDRSRPDGRTISCVAMHDPAVRRGLWFSLDIDRGGKLRALTLQSGREGESVVTLVRDESITGRKLDRLDHVLTQARFAYAESHAMPDQA